MRSLRLNERCKIHLDLLSVRKHILVRKGCLLRVSFNDFDLLLRQPIQLIHQRINLPARGLDLPLVEFLIGGHSGGRLMARSRLMDEICTVRSLGQPSSLQRHLEKAARAGTLESYEVPLHRNPCREELHRRASTKSVCDQRIFSICSRCLSPSSYQACPHCGQYSFGVLCTLGFLATLG